MLHSSSMKPHSIYNNLQHKRMFRYMGASPHLLWSLRFTVCANSTEFTRVQGMLSLRYPRVFGLQCNIRIRRAFRITYFSSSNRKWSGTAEILSFISLLYLLERNSASKAQASQKRRVRQPSLLIADSNFVYWLPVCASSNFFYLFLYSRVAIRKASP